MRLTCPRVLVGFALAASVVCTQVPALAQQAPAPKDGLLGAIVKSLTGDVYSEPQRWRELSWSTFFTLGRGVGQPAARWRRCPASRLAQ